MKKVLTLILIIIGIWWFIPRDNVDKKSEPIPVAIESTNTYTNPKYFFSLSPASTTILVYDEGNGAQTITFEDKSMNRSFQIFILPYTGSEITPERFKKDQPSGVQKNTKSITLDGAKGIDFDSTTPLLGEVHETWFIKNGFLYEVTVPKADEAWLQEIMKSWKFTK